MPDYTLLVFQFLSFSSVVFLLYCYSWQGIMSYQTSLSRKIHKVIFHSPVVLVRSSLCLIKQAKLHQKEDPEVCYTLRHVTDSCGLFVFCPEWIWTPLLMGSPFCTVTRSLLKSFNGLLKKWQLFLFRFSEIPSSELQQLEALWSLLRRLWNYILFYKASYTRFMTVLS